MEVFFNGLIEWFKVHGALGLGLNAWLESFIPVPPPDFLLIALDLSAQSKALLYALIATIGSAFGGLTGWLCGKYGGRPLFNKIFKKKKDMFEKVENLYEKYGTIAVAMAALTPVPYNIFAWASGILNMSPVTFTLISIFGRGARFFLVSILLMIFGETVLKHLKPIVLIVSVLLVIFYIFVFLFVKKKGDKNKEN